MNIPTPKCILVLAANPRGTDRVELERAADLIHAQLAQGRYGKDYQVQIEQGIRLEDLRRYLVKYKPTIVHVVGQGSATGEILLADDSDRVAAVTPTEIAHLFTIEEQQIECVVLNSCFSLEMADALLEFIPCTIGIDEDNYDPAAVTFISEFYGGIFAGKGYYGAYELGRKQIPVSKRENDGLPCLMTIDRTLLGIPPEYDRPQIVRGTRKNPQSSQQEKPQVYSLWYGTNRKPKDPINLSRGFSGEGDDRVHYGTCEVVVRKTHKFGSTGWLQQPFTGDNPRLRFDRASIKEMVDSDFWANVKSTLAAEADGKRNALVFIHGYWVSFETAAQTAAQLGCELKIPLTAFYSWPSKGRLSAYTVDEDSIQDSEEHIADFLSQFVKSAQADRVHIIAHSMGNRGLLRSIDKISAQFPGANKPFGQIFLAAPDVAPITFKNKAAAYQNIAQRTTLYISKKDKALWASSLIHKNSRAGFSPPVTIVPAIDTIDVSNTDLSLIGHGYCMEDRDVLRDMYDLLADNKDPDDRDRLVPKKQESEKYWSIE
jgi:esterase/lipase superfamily enzyme